MKFAIIGSCVSEDWLHYRDLKSTLAVETPPFRQFSSLVSLFSRPAPIPADLCDGLADWEAEQLQADFSKDVLPRLAEAAPDALIIDFTLDAARGLAFHDGAVVTNSFILKKSPLFRRIDPADIYPAANHPRRYVDLLAEVMEPFADFMRTRLPRCRLILHSFRYATEYLDAEGKARPFMLEVRALHGAINAALARLEAVAMNALSCDVISIAQGSWRADERHVWGLNGAHLERRYYREFQRELDRLLIR